MATPTTVEVKAGQTLLLYNDNTIFLRKEYNKDAKIATSWGVFVGTKEETDAKIKELSLSEIKRPLSFKAPKVVVKMKRVGIIRKLFNYLKQIF